MIENESFDDDAAMAELVDALASGASSLYGSGGSSPLCRTILSNHISLDYQNIINEVYGLIE